MGSIHDDDAREKCGNTLEISTGSECKPLCNDHRDSQCTDWKNVRKEDCEQIETDKENAAGTGRAFRLFRQWVDEASGALSVYCSYTAPGVENFDRAKHAFLVEVEFDFNQKNFRPVKAAEIVVVNPGTSSTFGTNDKQKPVVSGFYFCRLTSGKSQDIHKMILMK